VGYQPTEQMKIVPITKEKRTILRLDFFYFDATYGTIEADLAATIFN